MVKALSLRTPLTDEDVRSLRAGDVVSLGGMIVTGRDRVHKYLCEEGGGLPPFELSGGVLYHCGPVVAKGEEGYKVIAAGPTTSMRVDLYEADLIEKCGLRGIIGKGGMGDRTREALARLGCVYFHAVGGSAVFLADRIKRVSGVWRLEEFGPAEAMWCLEVDNFPLVVTMDTHGKDIHREIEASSLSRFRELVQTGSAEV